MIFIEPIVFHPINVYALKGTGFFFKTKRTKWGNQVRQGFNNPNIKMKKNNIYYHIDYSFKREHSVTKHQY
jgi:hypothetical protein